jgi:hypothetical protein
MVNSANTGMSEKKSVHSLFDIFVGKLRRRINKLHLHIQLLIRRCGYKLGKLKSIKQSEYKTGATLFDDSIITSDPWIFHDENWERVIHRWEHRCQVQQGHIVTVEDTSQKKGNAFQLCKINAFHIYRKALSEDRWVYLNLDPAKFNWSNYRWKFRMRLKSRFLELQFGIRYHDFYNRYRFRFQEDHLFFDEVYKGHFFNDFGSSHFPLELNRWYEVHIDAYKKSFMMYVDGVMLLKATDMYNRFKTGSIALILWERNKSNEIAFDIEDLCVEQLQ